MSPKQWASTQKSKTSLISVKESKAGTIDAVIEFSLNMMVSPETGDFQFAGGNIDTGGKGVQRVTGLSATEKPANNLRGINIAVQAACAQFEVHFPRAESDANYAVSITPNWMTSYCVSAKTNTGFTVHFGSAAPTNAKFDWIIVR